ncbi:hypothetical protein V6N11_064819 [Hibiscus sabdariffa]|uniref:RNase H type-1 domain-containing protein n=2 Tax=Hibiscus sabdariffa TaxID=183260 RepID=A0ABR2CJ49_9ROSI
MDDIIPSLAASFVQDALPWLEEAASQLSRLALGCFVTLLWNLWNRRNQWVHNQQLQLIWATVMTASLLQHDYLSVSRPTEHSATTPALSPVSWSLPVRDSSGQVLCGLAQHLVGPTNIVFAEHAALLVHLQLALDHGWPSVLIKTDSAQTVNILGRPSSSNLSIYGPSLEPTRAVLAAHPHIRLRFIPRSTNRVAHTLSSWALHCNNALFFDSVFPEIILDTVNSDIGI